MTGYAKTYGGALFDLASEEGLCERLMKDLSLLEEVFKGCPEYVKLLASPAVSQPEKESALDEAFEESLHRYSLNFVKLVSGQGRAAELCGCIEQYRKLYNAANGIASARAVSAAPLSKEQQERLKAALENRTGKKIELSVSVDESLIGGLRLEIDGQQFDSSLAYHLGAIKKLLKSDSIPE